MQSEHSRLPTPHRRRTPPAPTARNVASDSKKSQRNSANFFSRGPHSRTHCPWRAAFATSAYTCGPANGRCRSCSMGTRADTTGAQRTKESSRADRRIVETSARRSCCRAFVYFSTFCLATLYARAAPHRPGGTRTHYLRINPPLRLSPPRTHPASRVRGPDSVFTCASRGQVAPVESLHLPGAIHGCPAWLGVGISHRSPMLSAFTHAVSGAVLQIVSKSAALPVELPARGRLRRPRK